MISQSTDEEKVVEEQEEGEKLTSEQLLERCRQEIEDQKQADIEKGVRFTDDMYATLKYETNDIKNLKNLTVCIIYLIVL